MSDNEAYKNIEQPSDRSFGLTIGAVLLMVGCYLILVHRDLNYWVIGLGVSFVVIAFVWPASLKWFNKSWFRIGLLLGSVVSLLVMVLLYFIIVTPIGITMRILGKDLLSLRRGKHDETYWIKHDPSRLGTIRDQF